MTLSPSELQAVRDALGTARRACSLHQPYRDHAGLRTALGGVGTALDAQDQTAALDSATGALAIVRELGRTLGPDPAESRGPSQTGGGGAAVKRTPPPTVAVSELVRAIEALAP